MHRCSLLLLAPLIILAVTDTVHAQRQGTRQGEGPQGAVSGVVVDAATGSRLSGATVALWNARDSTLATGAIAGRDGSFSIAGLRPGAYYARITYVGYVPKVVGGIALRPGKLQADLGSIGLQADARLQQEVTVTAERDFMTVELDRTVYKTGDLTVSAGGNATDVLRNIPSVEVDPDDNVSLRGNQNVAIQLNGRPMMLQGDALANFLRGLPADAVERVEVVTNPSAKYDPEGMGGIINIVLDQSTSRGFSGGVNGAVSTLNTQNIGLNLAYGDGPWNILGSYSFHHGERGGSGDRYRENRLPVTTPIVEQISENERNSLSHSLNASGDYTFGDAGTASFSARLNRRPGDGRSSSSTSEWDAGRTLTRRYVRSSESDDDETSMDYRLGYKLVMEPAKHELSAEVRYGREDELDHTAYTQNNVALDGTQADSLLQFQHTTEDENSSEYALQIDYIRPLFGEGTRLEAGYSGEVERIAADFFSESFDHLSDSFHPDVALNNSYQYERIIHALYGTYGQEIGQFSIQGGLRLEQTMTTFDLYTTSEEFRNDYFSVFPSLFLAYKAGDALQFKASYSRRVQRPRTRALNPFISYDDPQFRRVGNPYLKPEYTDSYELSAVWFADAATLTATPFLRRSTDVVRRYELIDSNGISTSTFVNFDRNESYGVDLISTIRPAAWMRGFISVSAYRSVTDAGNVETDLGSDGFAWTARANMTFTLPAGFDLQASYFYRAPMKVEHGEMKAMQNLDVTLQKQLFDDRARVGLRVSDPFDLRGFSMIRDDLQYYQELERKWNSRGVYLTFSYSFGASDGSARRDRNRQGEPEFDMDDEGM